MSHRRFRPVSAHVFAIVLCAAALHAGWNALVRVGLDRLLAVTLIQVGAGILALVMLPTVSVPVAAAWPMAWALGSLARGL